MEDTKVRVKFIAPATALHESKMTNFVVDEERELPKALADAMFRKKVAVYVNPKDVASSAERPARQR